MTTKEIISYPDSVDATSEAMERPQDADSVLQPPTGGSGASSPKDSDDGWDLPCGCNSSPSPTL